MVRAGDVVAERRRARRTDKHAAGRLDFRGKRLDVGADQLQVLGRESVGQLDGAARFDSMLSPRHFRRRMAEVRIGADAAAKLAKAGVPIARAEGFEWHARSMEARIGDN